MTVRENRKHQILPGDAYIPRFPDKPVRTPRIPDSVAKERLAFASLHPRQKLLMDRQINNPLAHIIYNALHLLC